MYLYNLQRYNFFHIVFHQKQKLYQQSIFLQAWLGIFGIFGGPVLGLFTLGMFIPWASGKAALISATTSLLILLWIAIGGNVSRLNKFYSIPQLDLDVSNCENTRWNITLSQINDSFIKEDQIDGIHWWLHLPIYEISYMWYVMYDQSQYAYLNLALCF